MWPNPITTVGTRKEVGVQEERAQRESYKKYLGTSTVTNYDLTMKVHNITSPGDPQ